MKSSKKDKIINAILIVIYILSIGIILFLCKSNVFNKNKNDEVKEIVINDFKKVEIVDLDKKVKKLSFVNKKQDYVRPNANITINSNISNGKVSFSIKYKKIKVDYTLDEIENAIAVDTYVYIKSDQTHISYVLTKEGKVYKVEDNLLELKAGYKGTAIDLELEDITSIAIDRSLKLSLLEDKTKVYPFVYMKMDDGRIFTDEKFLDEEKIVELVEKEVKQTTENTSNNN